MTRDKRQATAHPAGKYQSILLSVILAGKSSSHRAALINSFSTIDSVYGVFYYYCRCHYYLFYYYLRAYHRQ